MPPKDATDSLVQHLAGAEQALSQSSGPGSQGGSNSLVNSEERDSVVEASAAMDDLERSSAGGRRSDDLERSSAGGRRSDDLERSSAMDTRSEVGSDGSRFHPSDAASMADGSRTDRMAAIMSDVDEPLQPSLQSLSISTWQRLLESQEAKKEVDAELLFANQAMEAIRLAHAEETKNMKQQLVDMKIDGAKDLFFGKKELEATVMLLKKQLLASEQKGENDASEMEIMRLNMVALAAGHDAEMTDMKGRLNPAMSGDIYKEFLKKQLADSNHANRAMGAELTALRLKMLDNDKVHQGEVGDLRTLLDAANLKAEMNEYGDSGSSSSHLLGGKLTQATRRKGVRPKKGSSSKTKLNAIEEEDDDAGSITAESAFSSFNVSSDGGGDTVGDMKDFDDDEMYELILRENTKGQKDIAALEKAAALQKEIAAELASEVAARETNTEERIEALIEQLALSRSNHAVTKGELASLRGEARLGEGPELLRLLATGRAAAAFEAQGKQQQASVPDEPDEEGPKASAASGPEPPWLRPAAPSAAEAGGDKDRHVEELTQQLNVLKEANRIAEARIADLKQTVEVEEARHKKEKEELTRRLQAGTEGGDSALAVNDLRDMLKSAVEEKNLLLNTLESKELRWKTEMENMQLELEQAERIRDGEASRYESDIALLKATIKDLESSKSVPAPEEPASPLETQPAAALRWLRCPARISARLDEGAEGRRPAFCQETCWAVVSAIPGAVALWCNPPEYVIQHASREASRIWGSSLLHEQLVFSLVGEASVGRWLKKAFESHERMADMEQGARGAPGFIVRDLGCESFTSRSGDTFECAVVAAHFPAEVVRRRPAAMLLILEPQARGGFTPPTTASLPASRSGSGGGQHAQRRGRRPASQGNGSEVSTSSVSPSDSASNVRGYG